MITYFKRRAARAHLLAVEAGKVCLFCDSTNVDARDAAIHCRTCGTVVGRELLGRSVSEKELNELNELDITGRF